MEKDSPSFVPSDSLSRAIGTIAERSQQIVADFLDRQSRDQSIASAFDPLLIGDAFLQMTAQMLASPVKLVEAQMSMWSDYMRMWQNTAQTLMGASTETGTTAEWRESDVFDFIKQTYLLTARWIQALVRKADGLDEESARQVDFYTRQFIDSMDPAQLFANNPRLLQITIDSQGENLVKGLDHLLGDLERSKLRLADPLNFGDSVAATKGAVVMKNQSAELLYYAPATGKARKIPTLLIPPWTHKFYALDLRPANSLVKWLTDEGHQLFVLSWSGAAKEADLATLMERGPLQALKLIQHLTGAKAINGAGIDLGGVLLALAQEKHEFASASYLAAPLDFSEPGELSVFVAEEQLRRLEEPGGNAERSMVNLLRANDLIWSFIIDCFHGERSPFPFDLLYWNADSLNVAPALQRFYLQDLYQKNEITDLSRLKAPAYVLALAEDHLVPWRGVFAGARKLGGTVQFVRGGSGHLSGLINPPAVHRFGFWTGARTAKDAESWAKNARYTPGSWWEDWREFLARHAGSRSTATPLKAEILAPAPGANVCAPS
jgi:polyhydroxyalkanoate synthase